ncbi:MAG: hypothetical protein Q9227_003736 [Pyrenula ochraceoflavens]
MENFYIDAGYRDPKDRIKYSLRSNAKYQLITIGCAIAGLVYISISNGFNFTAIRALIMALAYVWGLVLAIYLMGHGLVAVPRRFFRNYDKSGSLRQTYARAPKIHEKMEDAMSTLEELQAQVSQLAKRKTGTARDFQDWIDDLVVGNQLPESRIATDPVASEAVGKIPAIITERYLADLTRRLARAHHQRIRYVQEWDRLVQGALDIQTIIDSRSSKRLEFRRQIRFTLLTPYMRYLVYCHIQPASNVAIGSLLSLASVSIILSEIIKWPAPQISPVSLTVVHHPSKVDYQIGFGGQLIAAVWILYMCTCAISSLPDVPVWGGRALVPRNTYGEHATWFCIQLCKLTVPLSYNFLTFLPRHIHVETVFFQFLGQYINLTPLGKGFDFLFPILILFPVCATLFNLYGRIKSVLGFDILEDEDSGEASGSGFGAGGWREGRDLIEREVQRGIGESTLGLSPRTSTDTPNAAPTMWVPPSEHPAEPSQLARPVPRRPADTSSRQAPIIPAEPPEEDENIFQLFGKRVKNTIDTIDRPKWMQGSAENSTNFNFKRPKWMGGDTAHSSGEGGSGQGANIFGKLFSGRSGEGGVRI